MVDNSQFNFAQSTGYRWDRENRDRLYAGGVPFTGFASTFSRPKVLDPRSWLKTKNQRSMGSCRGHSGSTGMALIHKMLTGRYVDFSPMWLYLRTQRRDGLLGRDAGSTIENGVKVLKEEGNCRESVFPYPNPVRYSTHIPQGAAEDAANYKAGSYSPVDLSDPWGWALEYLGTGQGFIDIGTRWPFAHSGGFVDRWQPTGNGGHARAIVGYTNEFRVGTRNGVLVLIDANSHGDGSGYEGEFAYTEQAWNGLCRDRRSSVIGVSDMPTAKPREVNWSADSVNA